MDAGAGDWEPYIQDIPNNDFGGYVDIDLVREMGLDAKDGTQDYTHIGLGYD